MEKTMLANLPTDSPKGRSYLKAIFRELTIGTSCFVLASCTGSATEPNISAATPNTPAMKAENAKSASTYKAKIVGSGRLYETVEQFQRFMSADFDTQSAMTKRGYFEKLPMLEQGEIVTASSEIANGGMRLVATVDGRKGYVPYLLVSPAPGETSNSSEISIEESNAKSVREWFAQHKLPPTKVRKAVVHKVLYTITKIERLRKVGNENNGMTWAEAGEGFKYLVVFYNAKNLNKDAEEDLPATSAVRADDGTVYPQNSLASIAATETHKLPDVVDVPPGKQICWASAYPIPHNVSLDHLSCSCPTI
jgi:hypothetical protein